MTREQLLELVKAAPETVVDLILALQEQVRALTQEVQQLKERLAQNSTNSNKPPGSDGLSKAPAPKNLRVKSGRKRGGQPGHPGRTLERVENPDFTIVHPITLCSCGQCGGLPLNAQPVLGYEKRQVFDLPPRRLEVTEHRAEIKRCPVSGREVRASFPKEVTAPVQYGSRFNSLLVYLNQQQLLPFERLSQLCEDLFAQPVSLATLVKANETLHEALAGYEAQVVKLLQAAPVVNFDESGVRVAGKLHWLHTASTAQLTFYSVHAKRGAEAMTHADILSHFQGWAVHDFWGPYLLFVCAHAFCNAHLLRELKFLSEEQQMTWAAEMMELLLEFLTLSKTGPRLSESQIASAHERYNSVLETARLLHPRPLAGAPRLKQTKAVNLLNRLEDYEHCILAFLSNPEVPFTNNQAEQDIRMIKVRQKISGCFRTSKGASIFARIRGFVSTARKQGKSILDSLTEAFSGSPFIPEPSG